MERDHAIDRGRVFVTGLSAGGAMTAVMLATYPEVFAGGAIIAGLPYGAATSVQDAFESMFQGRTRPAREWGDLVRAASSHRGPWPKLSVWHGGADTTVKSVNADEIIKQWADVHGLSAKPTSRDTVDGYPRQVWRDDAGREVIESFTIASMAHGTPLATGDAANAYGTAGPFLLDVGISSTYHIAKFWGLAAETSETAKAVPVDNEAVPVDDGMVWARGAVAFPSPEPEADNGSGPARRPEPAYVGEDHGLGTSSIPAYVQSVIDKALKAAGLKT
jgi:poly(3-hydroxybutyrate) depolymerase